MTTKADGYENRNFKCSLALEHDYIFDAGISNRFSQDIIYYIAGFISKHLSSMLKCYYCTDVLNAKEKPLYLNLIAYKSHGKLIYPSDDLHKVCMKCESVFKKEPLDFAKSLIFFLIQGKKLV